MTPSLLLRFAFLSTPAVLAPTARAGVIGPQPWTVGSGVDCAYATISSALAAAAAAPGIQSIRVSRNQTYSAQALTIMDSESLVLTGGYDGCSDTGRSGHTALNGNGLAPVVMIVGSGDVSLVGMELMGGRGTIAQGATAGGGVYHVGSGHLALGASSVHDNSAQFGSGIAVLGSGSLTLSETVVRDNRLGGAPIAGAAGAVYFASTGAFTSIGTTLQHNEAGGVHVDLGGQAVLVLTQILDNDPATGPGGRGLRISGSANVTLDSFEIRDHRDSGILIDGSGEVAIGGGTISGNQATNGGGIALLGSGTTMLGGTIIDDNAAARGGGIHHAGSGLLSLDATRVSANASSYGSGIAVEGEGSLQLSGSTISANLPGTERGIPSIAGLYFASAGSLDIRSASNLSGNAGGGVYVERAASTEIRDSVIADNDLSDNGPGLTLHNSVVGLLERVEIRDDREGGLVHGGSGSLLIDTCVVHDNGPQPGVDADNNRAGGLELSGSGMVTLRDSVIDGNTGTGASGLAAGGVGYSGTGRLEIVDTSISNNVGEHGGGISAIGPIGGPLPTIWIGPGTRIVDNRADNGYGGGLALHRIDLDLSAAPGHEIARNTAAIGGGGLYLNGGRARIGSGVAAGNIRENRLDPGSGGGAGILANGSAELYLYTTDPEAPVAIKGNISVGTGDIGGGIAATGYNAATPNAPATRVYGYGVNVEGNVAAFGGGIAALGGRSVDGDTGAVVCLGRVQQADSCDDLGGSLPAAARACAPGIECNIVSSNTSQGLFGGAALFRGSSGDAATTIRVVGAHLRNNQGRSLTTSLGTEGPSFPPPPGALEIRDSLLLHNRASAALFDGIPPGITNVPAEASHALGRVEIERSTIGCNVIGAPWVSATRIDLRLIESIVHQPGVFVHAGNPSGVFARHVLSNEVATLPIRLDVVAGDPRFAFDDGVECDPHLGPLSPAIDFSNYASGGLDFEGSTRGQDRAEVLDRFGPRDLGALEREGSSVPPPTDVFANGFED